jgi:head-tail adaptor
MTPALTAGELALDRLDYLTTLNDICQIAARVQTQDSYGEMVETWPSYATAIACGVTAPGGRVHIRGDAVIVVTSTTVRLPLGTVIAAGDRLKITKRYGVALSPALVYEVVGYPQIGPTAIIVELQEIL